MSDEPKQLESGLDPLWCEGCREWRLPIYLGTRDRGEKPRVMAAKYCSHCGAKLEKER